MISNIIAFICIAIAALAGVYVIWAEIGPQKKKDDEDISKQEETH